MRRPLTPDEMFPANVTGITTRMISVSAGVRLRVAEGPIREEQGTAIVLLHGWGASLYSFRHAFDLLPAYGLRPIAVDLRGYGLSDKPAGRDSYSLNTYCADVDALLDALSLPRAVLVGHSMGGGLALRYAMRAPARVAKLVLVNPTGLVDLRFLRWLRPGPLRAADVFDGGLVPRWLVASILRRIAYGDPARVTQRDIDEYWAPTRLKGFVRAARAALTEFDWRRLSDADAQSLTVPSVVILGARDRLVGNTLEAAQRLPGTAVHEMDGGHCVHEEHSGEVYRIVGEFAGEFAR
ncbi:MAG TPA: alpha/beta hydrolase [Gemmatimonadaceae bacterium]|nr:alpha/beta hydrolase [Gemmatimonadaceae bacterium]